MAALLMYGNWYDPAEAHILKMHAIEYLQIVVCAQSTSLLLWVTLNYPFWITNKNACSGQVIRRLLRARWALSIGMGYRWPLRNLRSPLLARLWILQRFDPPLLFPVCLSYIYCRLKRMSGTRPEERYNFLRIGNEHTSIDRLVLVSIWCPLKNYYQAEIQLDIRGTNLSITFLQDQMRRAQGLNQWTYLNTSALFLHWIGSEPSLFLFNTLSRRVFLSLH